MWRRWAWILCAVPALLVGLALTVQFYNTAPSSDGAIFFNASRNAWTLPLKAEHFWSDWLHKESYVSIGLIGLTYVVGPDPVVALRILQFGLFAIAVVSFSLVCRKVFPAIGAGEATLLTFLFAITPAYLVYLVGVALDFIALTFLIAYLAALCTRRFVLAALIGTAFAFTKETSFVVYSLTLPFVLAYGLGRFAPTAASAPAATAATAATFFLPFALKGVHVLLQGAGNFGTQIGFCRQTSMAGFLFSPNLQVREIQSYLFDLFGLSFQWLLLIPIGLGTVLGLRRLRHDRRTAGPEAARVNWPLLGLVLVFLAAELYTITRCPVWNNAKYVIRAIPLYLLTAYGLSLYAFPAARWRSAFFVGVAILFGVSNLRTIDPVSLAFFGADGSGARTRVCMNSRTRVPEERQCGNDEMIYNLQAFIAF